MIRLYESQVKIIPITWYTTILISNHIIRSYEYNHTNYMILSCQSHDNMIRITWLDYNYDMCQLLTNHIAVFCPPTLSLDTAQVSCTLACVSSATELARERPNLGTFSSQCEPARARGFTGGCGISIVEFDRLRTSYSSWSLLHTTTGTVVELRRT